VKIVVWAALLACGLAALLAMTQRLRWSTA